MGIPVVISSNGLGLPVKQVDDGAPVMTVADNGLGIPIVIGDRGAPFVVQGGTPTPKLLIAVLAGQSNMEGIGNRDNAIDTDYAGIWQFGGEPGSPSYRAITTDITPVFSNDSALRPGNSGNTGTTSWLCPGEYTAREAIESGYADKVLLVPTARQLTHMSNAASPSWYPGNPGSDLFENMIAQANLAIAAAASYPDFAGHSVEIIFFWVQGEQDATEGYSQAVYAANMATLIAQARARITGASTAKFVIGTMLPNYWLPTGANYDASVAAINRAHVQASLENTATYYAMGAAGNVPTNDGRHYAPVAVVREQGRTMGRILTPAADGPTITSTDTVAATTGAAFSLSLTSDAIHATWAIVGGADAALFELSDPYLAPKLRWVGDGTGPATDGDYVVEVAASDGGHVQGAVQTITVTATTPAPPSAVTYVPATGSPFSGSGASGVANFVLFPNVPFREGPNTVKITVDARTVVNATWGGTAMTLAVDSDATAGIDCVVYYIDMPSAGVGDLRIQCNSSGFNLRASVGAMLGGATGGPISTAVKASGSVANPAVTSTNLVVPTNGLGIALARCGGATAITWNNGTEIEQVSMALPLHHSIATFTASSVKPSFNCAGSAGQAIAAAAWALA